MAEQRKFNEAEKTRGTLTLYGLAALVAVIVWLVVDFRAGAYTFVALGLVVTLIVAFGSKGQPTSSDE